MKGISVLLYLSVFIYTSTAFYLKDFVEKRQAPQQQQQFAPLRCGVSNSQGVRLSSEVPWKKRKVTYAIVKPSAVLSSDVVKRKIRQAFDTWSAYIPREFNEIEDGSSADIQIQFVTGDHGDDEKFEGPGGVYAHAKPEGSFHLDDSQFWKVYADSENINPMSPDLLAVAIHELGHVLGLAHTEVFESIMIRVFSTPSVGGKYREPRLIQTDIDDIREIYGNRTSGFQKTKREVPIAADCSTLIPNKDILGNNVGSKPGQPGDCCGHCRNNPKCKAFIWTDHEGGTCWFKSATQPAVTKEGFYMATA